MVGCFYVVLNDMLLKVFTDMESHLCIEKLTFFTNCTSFAHPKCTVGLYSEILNSSKSCYKAIEINTKTSMPSIMASFGDQRQIIAHRIVYFIHVRKVQLYANYIPVSACNY